MGSIYIKKLTKQDITRSYSPNTEATRDFFDIDLDNTQEYFDINVCYYGNREFQSGITIHKGYQGEKDWRICGANFKSLYAFRNPEEGDLSIWKRYGKKGNYQFSIQIIKQTEGEQSSKLYYKGVLSTFRDASLAYPDKMDLIVYRGLIYKELKNYERALEMANYLLAISEDFGEAYLLRSQIYEDMGEIEKSKNDKQIAISKNASLNILGI